MWIFVDASPQPSLDLMIMYGLAAEGRKSSLPQEVSDIRALLYSIRPELDETSDEYRAAVLLLAGPSLSFNIDRLSRRTRFSRQFVAMSTRRLFDNGVWMHDGPLYDWEEPNDERFWNDVEVAVGRSYRRSTEDRGIEWGLITSWRKKYDFTHDADAPVATIYLTEAEPTSPSDGDIEVPIAFESVRPDSAPRELTVTPAAPAAAALPATPVVADAPAALTTPMAAAALQVSMMELFPGAQWL